MMNNDGISADKCLKSYTMEVSHVVSCDLEWTQHEQRSGAGQSCTGRVSRHEMVYTQRETKTDEQEYWCAGK